MKPWNTQSPRQVNIVWLILIADTQLELRQQLVRVLGQAGHRAAAVATISEATGYPPGRPACAHCGRNIIDHGVEGDGEIFYCASCADHRSGLRDGT